MRNADYIPVGQIPMIDLGAQYEAAKSRREEAENRKLEYLSQFKRVRGPLTDGLKPEIQKRWDSIEALLEEGDMSLDGRKKLQQQYQDYADFASYGVDFTRALDEREAEVLANPERYNLDVLKELETYRTVTPTAEAFMNMSLPSLSQYSKYTPKKMSPWVISRYMKVAGEIYGRGPLITALPDIKTLNKTKELLLKNASLAVAGVYTAADDGVLNPNTVKIVPGAIIPVARNGGPQGPALLALPRSGDFNVSQLIINDMVQNIKRILLDECQPLLLKQLLFH